MAHQRITQRLQAALELAEIRVLDHFIVTAGAWSACVAWTDADSERQVHQDQSGPLFDVLYMAHHAIRASRNHGDRLTFELYRLPRDGRSTKAKITTLKLIVGPGDNGEPVITVLLSEED